jgi:hypothetical protein
MIRIILIIFFAFQVHAEEAAEPQEGAARNASVATPEQKATKELADVEKQVATLAARIKAKRDSVETLLRQKSVERDPEKLTEIVRLVQEDHRELEKLTREYNTQLGVLQYRFPERGVTLGRRYQRLDTKSLDEMEKTLGLEAHLKKSRNKVKTVYGVKDKTPTKSKTPLKKEETVTEEKLLQPSTLSK